MSTLNNMDKKTLVQTIADKNNYYISYLRQDIEMLGLIFPAIEDKNTFSLELSKQYDMSYKIMILNETILLNLLTNYRNIENDILIDGPNSITKEMLDKKININYQAQYISKTLQQLLALESNRVELITDEMKYICLNKLERIIKCNILDNNLESMNNKENSLPYLKRKIKFLQQYNAKLKDYAVNFPLLNVFTLEGLEEMRYRENNLETALKERPLIKQEEFALSVKVENLIGYDFDEYTCGKNTIVDKDVYFVKSNEDDLVLLKFETGDYNNLVTEIIYHKNLLSEYNQIEQSLLANIKENKQNIELEQKKEHVSNLIKYQNALMYDLLNSNGKQIIEILKKAKKEINNISLLQMMENYGAYDMIE